MACTTRIRSLRPLAAVAVGGLSLGLGSFCVLAPGQEAGADDVFEDISQADSRNGNPEWDGFRTTRRSHA